MSMFRAILVSDSSGVDRSTVKPLSIEQLPPGDVLVKVLFSTLNYKDALAITGRSPVVRQYPLVPGIDFAGEVVESRCDGYRPGDRVILNGWGVGEKHWGGLGEFARVRGEWLLHMPAALSPKQAMALGTAGYTAMLCVMGLERLGLHPGSGQIAVTGAAGGVGSIALMLLSRLGYHVIAVTGRPGEVEYLRGIGAEAIVDRADLSAPGKPLQKERWIGAIDTVGSHVLANVCACTSYGGVVAACGLAAGMDFPASVAPFILRGVRLVGIDSVMCPLQIRRDAWARLAHDIDPAILEMATRVISLQEAIDIAPKMLGGAVRGRVVVDVSA